MTYFTDYTENWSSGIIPLDRWPLVSPPDINPLVPDVAPLVIVSDSNGDRVRFHYHRISAGAV
jgi:hypothetical protein